ncbi:right-handed parallel beta-helix repeat-containing protein [Paenibacillus sp. FJAT-26967]|uniref:right-handed parallel beta-helix repeat-containing protein n=1 Tax=Paenibacillus sp. FJAT-26967 TaxID=1729690 RepID=UPI000A5EDB47|nr:right-handed parallel beta-helix repeat-containing protein [Paenibacillus sp. FJAT-26967]
MKMKRKLSHSLMVQTNIIAAACLLLLTSPVSAVSYPQAAVSSDQDRVAVRSEETAAAAAAANPDELRTLPVAMQSVLQEPAPLRTVSCATASCLQSALKKASAGDRIVLAPGTYTGTFSSPGEGTLLNRITIESQDAANPAVISGYSAGGGYALKVTGDFWTIRNLKFTNAQKGIILDHSNDSLISGVEVYGIGYEGVHFRDGSSRGRIENSYIHDTGTVNKGFGEGIYVGSAEGSGYNQAVHDTVIRGVRLGPNVTAEHIDIKERTSGTIVEDCIFNGTGISGENYADSFIDVKGNDASIRNNTGYRSGNVLIKDAFQLHQIVAGWGVNNYFSGNQLFLDNANAYVIAASNGTQAFASQNVRTPAGNLYTGNVTVY